MITTNDFWLQVHRLATAYEAEGETAADRYEQILAQFHDMPPIAQREVVADLLRLTVHVPSIYSEVLSDIRQAQHKPAKCA
jgi:hypothetical protein